MIPTLDQALRLIGRSLMPPHILVHSVMVRRVALVLGASLVRSGHALDLPLVEMAALLHDISKMECVGTGRDHALMGQELLSMHGYPLVADVVGQHVRLRSMALNEAMVVNYADKRVMHERVVSLDRRFVDLMARYGTDEARRERILLHHRDCTRIEEIISGHCDVDLDGLDSLNLIPVDETLDGG